MTTTPRPATNPEAEHLRREIVRTQRLAREAVDTLDVGAGIAHLRSLRSLVWRGRNLDIDLTEPALVAESPETSHASS